MNSKEVLTRFKECQQNNTLYCSQQELTDYLMCGLVLQTKNGYVTRYNKELDVQIYKPKSFNINLNEIINKCEQVSKQNKVSKIYCMSQKSFNDYKNKGYITTKQGKDFYKVLEGDLWYVCII